MRTGERASELRNKVGGGEKAASPYPGPIPGGKQPILSKQRILLVAYGSYSSSHLPLHRLPPCMLPNARSGAGEVFCPICLPGFNPDAFMHAHIDYLDQAAGLYLVLLAGSSDSFHPLSSARALVEARLSESGLLERLSQMAQGGATKGTPAGSRAAASRAAPAAPFPAAAPADSLSRAFSAGGTTRFAPLDPPCCFVEIETLPKTIGGTLGSTPLWHFICCFPARRQMISSAPCPLYSDPAGRQKLACAYAQLYSLVLDCAEPARCARMHV
jgi:hypothetical protein